VYLDGGGGGGVLFFRPKLVNRAGTCGGATSTGLTGSRRNVDSGFVNLLTFLLSSALLFFSLDDSAELVFASGDTI